MRRIEGQEGEVVFLSFLCLAERTFKEVMRLLKEFSI